MKTFLLALAAFLQVLATGCSTGSMTSASRVSPGALGANSRGSDLPCCAGEPCPIDPECCCCCVSCCESIEECLEMCPTAVICDDCSKCCVSKSGS